MDQMKLHHQQETSNLQLEHAKSLAIEREKTFSEVGSTKSQLEFKIRELERKHDLEVSRFNSGQILRGTTGKSYIH